MKTGGARQRTKVIRSTKVDSRSNDLEHQDLLLYEERKVRKRRQLSPKSLLISFGMLLPVTVLFFVVKRLSPSSSLESRNESETVQQSDIKKNSQEEVVVVVEEKKETRPPQQHQQRGDISKTLTAYLEHPSTLSVHSVPLNTRQTNASALKRIQYPHVNQCSNLFETFPIDAFPTDDPFLPWIHDFFPTNDGKFVKFVAQNRRRCDTGLGKEEVMEFWEPQMALFQPIPVVMEDDGRIRLGTSIENATVKETRFLCQFHTVDKVYNVTFSVYPFNYEYVSHRKGKDSMYATSGRDNEQFWLSQLLFQCPVPDELQEWVASGEHLLDSKDGTTTKLWLDLVPIRTPPRFGRVLFTKDHVPDASQGKISLYDLEERFGTQHYLPAVQDSGRWANLPICAPPPKKQHQLVACTWTSASYTRRGDAVSLSDTELRLKEWIVAHQMFGFDQLVVYDNTSPDERQQSPLEAIVTEFPSSLVTYHRWPCRICNNNRPNHPNPGERSSQYAAEASCRERYGPQTEWMAFIDTDEYLIPMANDTWKPIVQKFEERNLQVVAMRSSRTKPRVDRMEQMDGSIPCEEPVARRHNPAPEPDRCIEPRLSNETFLSVYNCDFIRPPKPKRFERAMKQLYRPAFVLSHFVHYSTVTVDIAKYFSEYGPDEEWISTTHGSRWENRAPMAFIDELNEGALLHTRTVLPHETKYVSVECQLNYTRSQCPIGFVCPDSTEFDDDKHKLSVFHDEKGNYCNCWANPKVEQVYAPKLKNLLA